MSNDNNVDDYFPENLRRNPVNLKKFHQAFKYPFSFMNKEYDERYSLQKISMTMFGTDMKAEKIDLNHVNFPDDIKEVYYYKKGKNEVSPWYFVGKISYKDASLYVYYEGQCDYTGFDCQGSMKLYISEHFDRIIWMAVPDKMRHNLIRKTTKKKNKCSPNIQQKGGNYNKLAYLSLKKNNR